MQPQRATLFQESILRGEWEAAARLLTELAHGQSEDAVSLSGFAILQQKYLEAVVRGDMLAALQCLRSELTPLNVNEQQLHSLAGTRARVYCLARRASLHAKGSFRIAFFYAR